jgi:mRNA interferase MazF
MKKDFKKWNTVKEKVNNLDSSNTYFDEREIWWCYLGLNVGVEEDGKGTNFMRPVLIVTKFNRKMCWVIPLSTVVSKGSFFFPLLADSNLIRMAILPQMRMIDVKRLAEKCDSISIMEQQFLHKELIAFIR